MSNGDRYEDNRIGRQIDVYGPVCIRYCQDFEGNPAGVIVDYEFADDFHYSLDKEAWQSFCDIYLNGEDNQYAFREFLAKKGLDTIEGEFAFEDALTASGIKYKKMAFY